MQKNRKNHYDYPSIRWSIYPTKTQKVECINTCSMDSVLMTMYYLVEEKVLTNTLLEDLFTKNSLSLQIFDYMKMKLFNDARIFFV